MCSTLPVPENSLFESQNISRMLFFFAQSLLYKFCEDSAITFIYSSKKGKFDNLLHFTHLIRA